MVKNLAPMLKIGERGIIMERKLTIGEVEELTLKELNEMLSQSEALRIDDLGITTEQFLNEFKDKAILTGEEDNVPFMSIDEFISQLEEYDRELNEEIENAEINTPNSLSVSESQNNQLASFNNLNNMKNRPEMITNITDKKQLFNLGRKVDKMLNECEGQVITIDKVLIKKYQKELDEPVVNEITGQIISDKTIKTSMSIVIVDENGVSYATGSKSFGYSLINAIYDFGDEIKGLKIKIIKIARNGNNNKSLDFEII